MEINKIYNESCLETLRRMPDNFVDCIITSPPYYGLRNYGKETEMIWDGDKECAHEFLDTSQYSHFCKKCNAWQGQLGLEPTFELYLNHLLQITKELFRVLKKTGTLFWNHGDSYSRNNNRANSEKSLLLQNYRLIQRMIDEQKWILRNTIIWHKPNAMPSSARDRLNIDYEPIFFFVKSNDTQYWINKKTGKSTWTKPQGIKGIEKIDWDWKEFGHSNEEEQESQDYIEETGMPRDRAGLDEKYKISPEEVARRYGYDPEGICPICGRTWKRHASPNAKDRKKGIRREFIPCRKQDNVPSKNANTYTGFNDRWKVKQTKIPEDKAENFGSPRARYHRKGRGSNNPELSNRHFTPIENRFKKVSNWAGRDYWFEMEYEPYAEPLNRWGGDELKANGKSTWDEGTGQNAYRDRSIRPNIIGRNKRCVWRISTRGFKEAHFACFPENLIKPIIKIGCPEEICKKCGLPREKIYREVEHNLLEIIGYSDCGCDHSDGWNKGIVYDPFSGSFTTAVVAKKLGRNYIGSELSKVYCKIGSKRLNNIDPLFNKV